MTYGDPAGGYYGGGPQQPMDAGPAVGLGKRFLARLIDVVIIGIVFGIIGAVADLGAVGAGVSLDLGGAWLLGVIQALVTLAYFAYLESSGGQTLGKMILSLRTQSDSGGLPTLQQAGIRNLWVLLPIIPILGGFLWLAALITIMVTIGASSSHQGLHDKYARTTVVNS